MFALNSTTKHHKSPAASRSFCEQACKRLPETEIQQWYSGEIVQQLSASADIHSHELEPVDLFLPTCTPHEFRIILSRVIKSGICGALYGVESDEYVENDQGPESFTSEENTSSSEESDD